MRGAMRRVFVLLLLLLAIPLRAADVEAGGAHVIAMPRGETGALDIKTSRGFGAHVDVFWTDRVSTRASAVFLNPAAYLNGIDLGTLGLDIYSVSARLHFRPQSRLSAFVGGGAALVSVGNLDDQFDDEIEVEFDPETTFVAEAGLRVRIHPRIVIEASAAYLPLELEAPAPLPSTIAVDPLIVSVGAAWRF
jgi:outer membrane protein W